MFNSSDKDGYKKISFWKQVMWHWFHKCPNCGVKVTTCWNSFTDYGKYHYKCDNCNSEFVDKN